MFGTLTLGRPMGIRLAIHWSFWLLPLFVLFSSYGTFGLAGAGFNIALLLSVFACVALHELGHAAAAKLFGIRTHDIVLYPLGGVASLERMPRNPFQEIVIALAGPAVNVVIGLLIVPVLLMMGPVETAGESVAALFLTRLLYSNVALVAFNMLPAFPMDGGRVLRAVLAIFMPRARATSVAATVGIVFAVGIGVFGLLSQQYMLLIIAFFIYSVGQAEEQQVHREEEMRDHWQSQQSRRSWPFVFRMPVVSNESPADGWVYDPRNGMWTKWEQGQAVARHRNP